MIPQANIMAVILVKSRTQESSLMEIGLLNFNTTLFQIYVSICEIKMSETGNWRFFQICSKAIFRFKEPDLSAQIHGF